MKLHTITCIEDNFTDEEIKETEMFVMSTLKPIEKEVLRDEGAIVLHLKSNEVAFNPIGFSAFTKARIEKLLRKI